jgi:hypothetical protein
VFEVASVKKAQKFNSDPEAVQAAKASGVIGGEYHFVEDAGCHGAGRQPIKHPFER